MDAACHHRGSFPWVERCPAGRPKGGTSHTPGRQQTRQGLPTGNQSQDEAVRHLTTAYQARHSALSSIMPNSNRLAVESAHPMFDTRSGVTVRMVSRRGEMLNGWGASRHFSTKEEAQAWIDETERRISQRAIDFYIEED
jgi:hypothetical protein